ncbi:uncharacterized protein LOC143896659 [Temnothorax americanus]|uniref:uncharacterized protein LOC143896659 n=1 Tax=Temnothorax americanus TaxID=1964332 RepID=UPI004068E1C8
MVCETVCTTVNTILCCTQKYKRAEDVDIKIGNIQSKTSEDIVKIIIEPEKNASIKPCISQAYVSQKPNSESLKRRSQNIVSTDNSEILGKYNIRFAKCKCGQQEQQNSSEDEIKLQVMIVTDKHYCGNLSEVDEPHRHNVPKIDIQNPSKVTAKVSQSRRLPQPELLVTSSNTRNSQCRAGNSTTSTSYLPIKEQELHRKKQDRINSYPLTSTKVDRTKKSSKRSFIHLSKYITRIFRHSAPEIKIKVN